MPRIADPTPKDRNTMEPFKTEKSQLNNVPIMAMKKRYVKRLVRKVIFLLLTVAFISLVTTMIVEKRLGNGKPSNEVDESNLDPNGDAITPEFRAANIVPTRRAPRPPFQDRNAVREEQTPKEKENTVKMFTLPTPQGERKDWNDYQAMEDDKMRSGTGEHGLPAKIEDPAEKELEDKLYRMNGFNGLLSDKISVNRSLPDVRREECKTRQYLAKLPKVSVVIIFFNEHFKTLLRSVYSIINRSPPELLQQIVLVDDGSEWESLKQQLDDYVSLHWPDLVDVVHNPERLGLIGARLSGAKVATAEVMVFFDSHIEVNYNWLPPLLEPIAINNKISTCPIVDIIDHSNFAYNGGYQEGSRGGFDWRFYYKQLPVLPEDSVDKSQPYRSPVMMGGLFAINTEFFWSLGGYDDELDIWGGEQYELSFKIWMCGGMLLDVPCSRVAHIFRGPMDPRPNPRNYNFVARNHKRVAEVWMDEYKEYVYTRDPQTYDSIDAGDLRRQRAIRETLQCKSFDWYMKEVAPDFLIKFPPIEPQPYASGAIQSLAYPQLCLDAMNLGTSNPVGLYSCHNNLTLPEGNQMWLLTADRELRRTGNDECLDVQDSQANATVWMWDCHNQGGNQFWYYDRQHQWIVHGKGGNRCMEAFVENNVNAVYTNDCQENNDRQRWNFGVLNHELLDRFFDNI
ncbi:N-acetylgalactosaminyltransferase 4-like isoform X1 [Drosophila albomicans]|uniref:Polypeptide N-acetylgalactosaminyltransferase n=2 Tax=Drosophila albomicans TaxID=7291 RepID=A0A9C6T0P1_DROAB|nr:N-acetylgalactosaminyltransferase 4-like isoform X1 [Drosophila albomicans]